jgi:ABC-type transporter Mla MlaB component
MSISNNNKNFINDSFLNYKTIDLKNLDSIDSSIIIFCIQLARFFKNKNKTIQIVNLKTNYRNLFSVYGLNTRLMNLYFNE